MSVHSVVRFMFPEIRHDIAEVINRCRIRRFGYQTVVDSDHIAAGNRSHRMADSVIFSGIPEHKAAAVKFIDHGLSRLLRPVQVNGQFPAFQRKHQFLTQLLLSVQNPRLK